MQLTSTKTAYELDVLWESARRGDGVTPQAESMLEELKRMCAVHGDLAPAATETRAREGLWGTIFRMFDLQGCRNDLELQNAMKHVAASVTYEHPSPRYVVDNMWYAVQFYAEYCAEQCDTEFVVEQLLDIVDHFPHQPQSGNR